MILLLLCFFFFNDTATTEFYTLSLHDALPIYGDSAGDGQPPRLGSAHDLGRVGAGDHRRMVAPAGEAHEADVALQHHRLGLADRKSTRLNSSHANISYAVFCLKKKKSEYHNSS